MSHIAIASPEVIEAGSVGLVQIAKDTVSPFMDRLFRSDRAEDAAQRGHVALAAPSAHPLAMGHEDSPLSLLLDIPDETLWRIQLCETHVVVQAEPGLPIHVGQVLDEEAVFHWMEDLGERFEASMGGEAIARLLGDLDLPAAIERARTASGTRAEKRLALLERYARRGLDPASLVLRVLPIVPRALRRPGTRAEELDELYRAVLQRTSRLSLMFKHGAVPELILRNQKALLSGAVEALFANGRGGRTFARLGARDDEQWYSLSDLLHDHGLDVSGVFEGHRVPVEPSEEVAAVLRGIGLQIASD